MATDKKDINGPDFNALGKAIWSIPDNAIKAIANATGTPLQVPSPSSIESANPITKGPRSVSPPSPAAVVPKVPAIVPSAEAAALATSVPNSLDTISERKAASGMTSQIFKDNPLLSGVNLNPAPTSAGTITADGKTYNVPKSSLSNDANLDIINQNREASAGLNPDIMGALRAFGGDINKASNYLATRSLEAERASRDTGPDLMTRWQDAIKQAGIGATTGGIKYARQAQNAIAILQGLMREDTANRAIDARERTDFANIDSNDAYRSAQLSELAKKGPQVVQGEDNIYSYNPKSGQFEPTGIKPRSKEFKPDTVLDNIKKISDIRKNYAESGQEPPKWLADLETQLTGSTKGKEETPPLEGARRAPDGNWYIQRNGKTFKVEK